MFIGKEVPECHHAGCDDETDNIWEAKLERNEPKDARVEHGTNRGNQEKLTEFFADRFVRTPEGPLAIEVIAIGGTGYEGEELSRNLVKECEVIERKVDTPVNAHVHQADDAELHKLSQTLTLSSQAEDNPGRLTQFTRDFALPHPTINKGDRDLSDRQSLAVRLHQHLNLKGVAGRDQVFEIERGQEVTPVDLKAGGGVAHRQSKEELGDDVSSIRVGVPFPVPTNNAATWNVA